MPALAVAKPKISCGMISDLNSPTTGLLTMVKHDTTCTTHWNGTHLIYVMLSTQGDAQEEDAQREDAQRGDAHVKLVAFGYEYKDLETFTAAESSLPSGDPVCTSCAATTYLMGPLLAHRACKAIFHERCLLKQVDY